MRADAEAGSVAGAAARAAVAGTAAEVTDAVSTAFELPAPAPRPALAAPHAGVRRHVAAPVSAAGVAHALRKHIERDEHARRVRPRAVIAEEPS